MNNLVSNQFPVVWNAETITRLRTVDPVTLNHVRPVGTAIRESPESAGVKPFQTVSDLDISSALSEVKAEIETPYIVPASAPSHDKGQDGDGIPDSVKYSLFGLLTILVVVMYFVNRK